MAITLERALQETVGHQPRALHLTPRWTSLRPHEMQQLFMWHTCRFKVCPAGRRSGKTEIVKRKACLKLLQKNKQGEPGNYFIGAPTKDRVRKIYWNDMKRLIPRHWVAYKNETRMEIMTHWGAQLTLLGFERPEVIEGVPWDWGACDEFADYPPGCFELNIEPALSTLGREGGIDFIGVPDEVGRNQAEYEALWEEGLRWPNNSRNICSFHWPSWDILTPEEIASKRGSMDKFAFEQEYGGLFVSSGGKACPKFDVALHANDEAMCDYCPQLPLDWTLDFGVSPAVSLIGQTFQRHMWIMDEIELMDGSTDVMAEAFVERCSDRGYGLHRIRVYGDAAGGHHGQTIGISDYELLRKKLGGLRDNIEWNQLTVAPAIKDTLNAVRAGLCSADNVIHLFIHPRCRRLIQDLKTAPWPNDLRQFHALAALRYYCYRIFGESGAGGYSTAPLSLPNLQATAKGRGQ